MSEKDFSKRRNKDSMCIMNIRLLNSKQKVNIFVGNNDNKNETEKNWNNETVQRKNIPFKKKYA